MRNFQGNFDAVDMIDKWTSSHVYIDIDVLPSELVDNLLNSSLYSNNNGKTPRNKGYKSYYNIKFFCRVYIRQRNHTFFFIRFFLYFFVRFSYTLFRLSYFVQKETGYTFSRFPAQVICNERLIPGAICIHM